MKEATTGRNPEISQEMSSLKNMMDSLALSLENMEKRLDRVIRQQTLPNQPKDIDKVPSPLTVLGAEIREVTDSLNRQKDIVERLIESLEI